MLRYLYLILAIVGCAGSSTEDKISIEQHPLLIRFDGYNEMNSDDIFDLSDQEYKILSKAIEFNSKTDTVLQIGDTLYISFLELVNECQDYIGNIEIKSDTVFLQYFDTNEMSCMSERIDRLKYHIYNPEHKSYTLIRP